MKKLQRQIEALTRRLVTCPLEDFDRVQAELFKAQRQLKEREARREKTR